jgi:NAD(P)-dependent dehydrogenase (short-subunit alcohol dehydrogenase family)
MIDSVSKPINIAGQTAVVTGAAGNISSTVCETLARYGANIVATDLASDRLDAVAEGIEADGGSCVAIPCDVTDPNDIRRLAETAIDEAGRIQILANVAGIVQRYPFSEMSLDDWNRILTVNLTGTFSSHRRFTTT